MRRHFCQFHEAKSPTRNTESFWKVRCFQQSFACHPPIESPAPTGDTTTKPIPIGVIHLTPVDSKQIHHRRTEIGLNIVRRYQGQGFGTEAIKWALHWGFRYAAMHRIELGAFAYNTGAVKLYEKLGFFFEGRKRDFVWFDGQYWDLVMFSMLEDEWREKFDKH